MAGLIMTGRIRIIARVAGFRRAGVAHVGERLWPADAFSAEQLAQLKAEPRLIVEEVPDETDRKHTEAQPAATSEGDGEAQPGPVGDASAAATEAAVLPASDGTAAAETGEGSTAEPDKAADPDPAAETAEGEKSSTKKTTTRSRKTKSA